MYLSYRIAVGAAAITFLALPPCLRAQDADDDEPVIHYITTTSFNVAFGDDFGTVLEWIDSVVAPINQINPHMLSFRVATHRWGSQAGDIVFIREYETWDAIEADCEACDEMFDDMEPEEGTPEREAWDERLAVFLKYNSGHRDEIYHTRMSRAKN